MKKLFFALICLFSTYATSAQSNCSFTHSVSGSTAIFNHMWVLPLIYSLDSIHLNYGDGTSQSYYAPVPVSSNHTFPAPGTYNVCLTRYLSLIGSTTPIVCTYCDSVTITGGTGCTAIAGFVGMPAGGLSISFNNVSSCFGCSSTTYLWNFGDGSAPSNVFAPTHTYATPGSYVVCLTVLGISTSGTTCTNTYCDTIVVGATTGGCIALPAFTAIATGPTSFLFNNSSSCISCGTSLYLWDFGDGSTPVSTTSPTHTYAMPGTYTVCLTMMGVTTIGTMCDSTTCFNVTTTAPPPPCPGNAAFTHTSSGLNVTFNNTSTCVGCISSYMWDFGDGSLPSLAISPSHTYATAGTYTVCLYGIFIDSSGNTCLDTLCLPIVVSGTSTGCTATANFSMTNSGATYNFTNTSTCTGCTSTNYVWSFGDGTGSALMSPSHTYTANGTYNVCLIVYGSGSAGTACIDTICKPITVTALGLNNIDKKTLHLYPNPTSNDVILDLPQGETEMTLKVHDISGRIVHQARIPSSATTHKLSMQAYSKGLYTIELRTEKSRYLNKVVKE